MIYLDHAATTPLDPRVREAMLPWLGRRYGNPSSRHAWGRDAARAVECSREIVARALGARPENVVFTASGTEANNLLLQGLVRRCGQPVHLVVSAIEHTCVLQTVEYLRRTCARFEASFAAPGADGRVMPATIEAALRPDTRLVCLMRANNETGVIQPIEELAARLRARGVPLHCDAVQSFGKSPSSLAETGASSVAISAHKFYGPQGAGALACADGVEFDPVILGGGQEGCRRAGTENVAAIVGLAEAVALALREREKRAEQLGRLDEAFRAELARLCPRARIAGGEAPRLPGLLCVALESLSGAALAAELDREGIAVSVGAACAAAASCSVSHVLTAMSFPAEYAAGAVRVSFGKDNSETDARDAARALARAETRLRRDYPGGRPAERVAT